MEPVPFVDLAAQYRSIGNEVDAAIKRVLSRCNFILGAELEEFENEFAGFVGAMRGVGVSNGLEALRLSLQALGIREGDEIVVPANTFIATALAVRAIIRS